MRTRALLFFTLLSALWGGCVIHDNQGRNPLPGNVDLLWTFSDGSNCSTLSGFIGRIQVVIPGETLQNSGSFPCNVSGTQGIQLQNFAPGTYSVTVNALDQSGSVLLYTGSGSFTVDGDISAAVTLVPQASGGNVDVRWSFTDGNTCASLGGLISSVQVVIPGETLQNGGVFPCQVNGTQGIQLQNFAPGSYNVSVTALDRTGNVVYGGSNAFNVNGNTSVNVPLGAALPNPQPGNVDVHWSFADGQTCASLGGNISGIQVTIPGETLQNNGFFPCQVSGTQGIQLQNFAAGSYSITVQALNGAGGVAYLGSSSFAVDGNISVSVSLNPNVPNPQPGNINLTWSFADGQTCGSLGPFVNGIQVSIPGQTLANSGFFSCQSSGTQGIQLQNFAPGGYSITVQALSSAGHVLYQGQVGVTVNGSVSVSVALQPVNTALPGNVDLLWSFTDGNVCNQLGGVVDHIVVNIPGEALQNGGNFPCSSAGVQGIQLQNFAAAHYTYTVAAVDGTGVATYTGAGSFDVNGDVTETVGLAPTHQGGLGDISLRWSFLDSNHSQSSCNGAGVEQVAVSIGSYHQTFACSAGGVDGADFPNLVSGTYQVVLDGYTRDSHGTLVDAYTYNQNVVVLGGRTALVQAQLDPLVGSLDLAYQFASSSCLSSGVADLTVEILDANNNDVSGLTGQSVPCADGANFNYENFAGGNYRVIIRGYNAATIQTWGADGTIVVVAGAANAATATLYSCGQAGSGC